MKKITIVLSTLFFIFITTTGFNKKTVITGNTNSKLGSFIIIQSDQPLITDTETLRSYDVKYENSDMDLRIVIDDRNRKCLSFIVVSGDFGIQYNCDKHIFGVVKVDDKYIKDGIPKTDERLNRVEYYRQKVLISTQESETNMLRLIAVYFPNLMTSESPYTNSKEI